MFYGQQQHPLSVPGLDRISTVNCQPGSIFVLGNANFAGEPRPLNWSQITREGGDEQQQSTMDPDIVARAFVDHYYTTFDADRAALAALYQEDSMLTFEGEKIQGAQNIVSKLTSLPFQQCQHQISTFDCQLCGPADGPANGMLVFVCGNLQLAGEAHARKFSQMFHLTPTPQGSFHVLNDIFRLNSA